MTQLYHAEQLPLFQQSRICLTCLRDLPFECFNKQKCGKDGYRAHCKECRSKERKEAPPRTEWVEVSSKVCPRCETDKPIEEFSLSKSRKNGHHPICKVCERQSHNSEEAKGKRRAYEQEKKLDPEYRAMKREKHNAWRHANAEEIRERNRIKYATDPVYARRVLDNTLKWWQENPLKRTEHNLRRKALLQGNHTEAVSYERIIERDGMFCYICSQEITLEQPLDFDHVLPLSRGGEHSHENIRPTHACCNRRKGTKLIEELTPYQRRGPDN